MMPSIARNTYGIVFGREAETVLIQVGTEEAETVR